MAWCHSGNKPLSEWMLTQFLNIYMYCLTLLQFQLYHFSHRYSIIEANLDTEWSLWMVSNQDCDKVHLSLCGWLWHGLPQQDAHTLPLGLTKQCFGIAKCFSEFLAATKQMVFSVCLSVCLSVCPSVHLSICHTFLTTFPSSYHHETKYLKTVCWRNHTEKLTPLWPQNISFWPKINIPSSYFTILKLNCLENTLKLQFDSYVTAFKFLT